VFLYTLTRGEASRNAAFQGITGEEIAAIRVREVHDAAALLGVSRHLQGSYPDGGLRDLDPRVLENDLTRLISDLAPQVLVTFDVQGGSVHPDHICIHHAMKRVFVEMRGSVNGPQRLCFAGHPADRITHWPRKVFGIPSNRIHAVIDVSAWRKVEESAVMTHKSVRRDVEEHNYDDWMFWPEECYSFFQETFDPPVNDLLFGIKN
jgi:LmbE family N-acetylglucosaminyl deacetylase